MGGVWGKVARRWRGYGPGMSRSLSLLYRLVPPQQPAVHNALTLAALSDRPAPGLPRIEEKVKYRNYPYSRAFNKSMCDSLLASHTRL